MLVQGRQIGYESLTLRPMHTRWTSPIWVMYMALIRETDFEKPQPIRDCDWCRVVDGAANLSSAVTSERGAVIRRQS
jgi:hypothetical protein